MRMRNGDRIPVKDSTLTGWVSARLRACIMLGSSSMPFPCCPNLYNAYIHSLAPLATLPRRYPIAKESLQRCVFIYLPLLVRSPSA